MSRRAPSPWACPAASPYAFDAASCQLRYAWTGDFLDAKPAWTWRGGLPPRVLGRKFYTAPDAGSLRLETHAAAEPRFLGYELVRGFPRFSYELAGATVTLLTTTENNALVCFYEVSRAGGPILLHAGPDGVVTSDPAPARGENGWWKLAPGDNVRVSVRIPLK